MSATLRSFVGELFDRLRDRARPPCVLVVEARRAVRERIRQHLASLGCATRESATPLETILVLERDRRAIDGVAIGPGLTQTRADELIGYLRETYPDLPIVVVDDEEPRRAEAVRLLLAPWSPLPAAA